MSKNVASSDPARGAPTDDGAPASVEAMLALLPDLAAVVVGQDVASGRMGGVRSVEHDRLVEVVRALRLRVRAAEASAHRALAAAGYDATSALRWLRSDDPGEPRAQRADDDVVRIPLITRAEDVVALGGGGPPSARRGAA